MGPHRVKVVDGAFEVAHEAVHVSDGRVGGGVLGDENQSLAVVLQRLVVLPTATNVMERREGHMTMR